MPSAQRPGRAKHEIVLAGGERIGERPGDGEAQPPALPLADREEVAVLAKGEDRLDAVKAVGLARAYVQSQVDLGEGGLLHAEDQRAASRGVRPVSILARSRSASGPSA